MFGCESWRDRPRLAPEALDVVVVGGVVLVQDLERDIALEQPVVRAVDAGHAARADELLELVPPAITSPTIIAGIFPAPRRLRAQDGSSACSQTPSASSSSASVIDERREHADAVRVDARALSSSSPSRERLRRTTAVRARVPGSFDSRSWTSSIASIAPRPRTSPIAAKRSCQREHPRADRLADRRRARDQVLVVDHVEHGERRRLRDRVADVGAADRRSGPARP